LLSLRRRKETFGFVDLEVAAGRGLAHCFAVGSVDKISCRLGPGQYTQYSLKPLPALNVAILSVALGQDHTLVLTKSGEVYSWGLNRFSQLGYIVETSSLSNGRHEEPMQSIPKRVMGPLKKEVACGVAASKNASARWTDEKVFTWGTNTGQLGELSLDFFS